MNAMACRHERRAAHGDFQPSPLWQRPDESFPELDADYQALRAPTPEPIDQELPE